MRGVCHFWRRSFEGSSNEQLATDRVQPNATHYLSDTTQEHINSFATKAQSTAKNPQKSIMPAVNKRIQNISKRIQNAQEIRSQKKEEYVLKELQDQNTYLMEKLTYLQAHKIRNEKEINRLSEKNLELQKLQKDMGQQIRPLMGVLKDWDGFRKEVLQQQQIWGEKVLDLQERTRVTE